MVYQEPPLLCTSKNTNAHRPRTGSPDCRGNGSSGRPLDTPGSSSSGAADIPQQQNACTSHQSNAGPDRTGFARGTRFEPYKTYHAHSIEHFCEEAGPLTLVLPPIEFVDPPTTQALPPTQPVDPPSALVLPPIQSANPPTTFVLPPIRSLGLPTMQPSGGAPETSADAEYDLLSSEEEEAPVSSFYHSHIPHAPDRSSGVRSKTPPGHLVARASLTMTMITK